MNCISASLSVELCFTDGAAAGKKGATRLTVCSASQARVGSEAAEVAAARSIAGEEEMEVAAVAVVVVVEGGRRRAMVMVTMAERMPLRASRGSRSGPSTALLGPHSAQQSNRSVT